MFLMWRKRIRMPNEPVSIGQVLREGRETAVQVIKDQLGTRGARLTTNIPSRYLVFMPNAENIGVSSRITKMRTIVQHLKNSLLEQEHRIKDAGYIIRTAAEVADNDAIASDIKYLNRLTVLLMLSPEMSYTKACRFLQVLRDMVDEDFEEVGRLTRERGTSC